MKTLYTAVAHATGDSHNGEAYTDDELLRVNVGILRTRRAGRRNQSGQMFAAGYAASSTPR